MMINNRKSNHTNERFEKAKKDINEKYKNSFDDKNWIGTDLSASKRGNSKIQEMEIKQESKIFHSDFATSSNIQAITSEPVNKSAFQASSISKSPTQLVQDLLKGLTKSNFLTELSPYYSRENQELLGQLLTNKMKQANYIKNLQHQMAGAEPQVVRNYQVLVMLLQQISSSDVQVRHSSQNGLEIKFNQVALERQEQQIERLQRQLQQKQNQTRLIVEEYESIIRNFNEVMEGLISAKQEGKAGKNKY